MNNYLSKEDLDAMNFGHVSGSELDRIIAQARQAPDPTALPLSTAMREARRRTEAGQETWVYALVPSGRTDSWLARLHKGTWQWSDNDIRFQASMPIGWIAMGLHHPHMVENAVCRLVTPSEGTALLRGES